MLQCFINCNAFVRVKGEQLFEQVDCLLGTLPLLLLESGEGGLAHGLEQCLRERGVDGLDVLLGGVSDGADYLLDLVERGRAREDGLADDQLAQDAACAPHVHGLRLHRGAQQDLGRTLPAGRHLVREDGGLVVVVLLRHRPCQPEVSHLHVAFGVEQQVGRLQVAVDQVA